MIHPGVVFTLVRPTLTLVGLAAALSLSIVATCWAQAPPKARATRAAAAPRVDGVLDEEAWRQAPPIGPLTQREPDEGAPPTEDTDVRVLFTENALYFGILCRDRTPRAIVAAQLTRDTELDSDDSVLVALDPFFDHRNGFFFQVNAAGARVDGQIANNDEETSRDWDGIWEAAARITPEGWVAEIAIPFKTLRFKPGQTTWGLNVERVIKRRNETDRWAAARRDIWIANLSEAGLLEGLEGIHQGRGLDIRPYLSGGEENRVGKFTGGLDVFKNLTPNMNASVTVNTDFAETEVDARQINLTRFPLFFPEKRAFFLEGAGVFNIAGTSAGYHGADLLPFFTRRIGLLSGSEVPILAGTKVVGRQSDYNIGVLDVQTRQIEADPATRASQGIPDTAQNLFAARVSRNVATQSYIGGIVTYGNPAGTGRNTLVGADARFATSTFRGNKNLSSSWFLLRTDDQATGASDYAFGANVDYPNDLVDCSASFKQIGNDFAPALGFVPRTGIRKFSPGCRVAPRPHRWSIRRLQFEVRPTWLGDLHNVVQNWDVEVVPVGFEMESGDRFELSYLPQYERLPEPFEISDGIAIPTGGYRWTAWGIGLETANKRPWVGNVEYSWGGFYNGTRREMQFGLTLKPSTHFATSFEIQRNDITLPAGAFQTRVFTVRADYNFSPDVSWANLVQYDNESRIMGVQSRFRWILRPGNDIFIVVNRGWYRREFDSRYLPAFDKGSLKLQYTFRL